MKFEHSAPLLAFALSLAACSSDDGGGASTFTPPSTVTTYAAYTRDGGSPSLRRGDASFRSDFGVITSANRGASLDWFGNAYQAEKSSTLTGVRIFRRTRTRSYDGGDGVFAKPLDRVIGGFATTLDEPQNAVVLHRPGLLLVTDSADDTIKFWGTEADGDAAPAFTIALAAAPHDAAYDEENDRLFVTLGDGSVAVFDAFAAILPAAPTRVLLPSEDGVNPAAARLAGIALDMDGERLVLTDPGAPDNGNDGRVLAIDGGAAGSGAVPIVWSESSLGYAEPLDVVVDRDGVVRVADLERDRLVAFRLANLGSGSLPSIVQPLQNPVALVLEPSVVTRDVASPGDIDDPARALDGLLVAAGADGLPATITLIDEGLATPAERTFAYDRDVRSLAVDALGNAYVGTPDGAVSVISRLTTQRGTGANDSFDLAYDRDIAIAGSIFGGGGGPQSPGELDVDIDTDLIIVCDQGGAGIYVFGRSTGSDAEELRFLTDAFTAGSAEPVALDYDAENDRLWVGVSNGVVYVYDSFVRNPGTSPDRFLTPSNALGTVQVSTSISSLVYDDERDVLLLADVGVASGAGDDGALYVFQGASTASGLVAPDVTFDGGVPGLDDPVSIAWNGADLWVADRGNGEVARFADVLMATGPASPAATTAVADVSAIALVPSGLAPDTGGSLQPAN